jgi:hypothetical protein
LGKGSSAKNLKEAEYEIGDVSKLIWKLYPQQSKLLVFASGGGEKWGGEYWENASKGFKNFVSKYHLIDLYDGNHPGLGAHSESKVNDLCDAVSQVIKDKSHQTFHFHNIGPPTVKDIIKGILLKQNLSVSTDVFKNFVECIGNLRNQIWIAPLVQILKYETEFNSARLEKVFRNEKTVHLVLKIWTDSELYDQKLSLIVISKHPFKVGSVKQNNEVLEIKTLTGQKSLVNIRPINSEIFIDYH